MRVACIVACLASAGCGRIGFDLFGSSPVDAPLRDGSRDGAIDSVLPDGPPMLSCIGLAATCGPSGTSSCCTSPIVSGGMFLRGYDVAVDGAYPDMSSPATLSDFRLDTYEVTVSRFREFVIAGMGTQASPPVVNAGARTLSGTAGQGGWETSYTSSLVANTAALTSALACGNATWTNTVGANESLPINCVSWYEAFAFCVWDGGFLPTEAELNYAAAGGSEQRAFPWSSPAGNTTSDCAHTNGSTCGSLPNRVGSESPTGDTKWGQADVSGNVWEWTLDWYGASYPLPCTDCAQLTAQLYRTAHGGYYNNAPLQLRGAFRGFTDPTLHSGDTGVRCARIP